MITKKLQRSRSVLCTCPFRVRQVLLLSVYDRDAGPGDDDFLGGCELPLSVLQADVESSHNIPLSKTTSGSLLLKAT